MSLAERRPPDKSVSLETLLSGTRAELRGESLLRLRDYVEEIVASGFPAIRASKSRVRRSLLDGYLQRVSQRDFEEQGRSVRRSETLFAWLRA
jgi:hypothetical protein